MITNCERCQSRCPVCRICDCDRDGGLVCECMPEWEERELPDGIDKDDDCAPNCPGGEDCTCWLGDEDEIDFNEMEQNK